MTSEHLAARFKDITERHITTAAVTARARDLRKQKFGAYPVRCERRGELHVYFLDMPPAVVLEGASA